MIIVTAGHVDHGKSSLIAALTGQRTDRLPQEQRRGLTIEPGFTHADLGDGVPVDFVDLPGHVRYLRHMLAGVTAADAALLVVAADDGVMPQTREHLAILRALGVAKVVPVLTKIDRADAARQDAVRQALRALLQAQGFDTATVVPVCAPAGQGIAALQSLLRALNGERTAGDATENGVDDATDAAGPPAGFRLAVDRVFNRPGLGVVAAGTPLDGRLRVGDELRGLPCGGAWRVRGIQRHGRPVAVARAGRRCGLNLVPMAGTKVAAPARGDWLVAPCCELPTRRLDVCWFPVDATAPGPWSPGRRIQVHLGATERSARLVPLDDAARFAQLLLDEPVGAFRGDRLVLRDAAGQRLLGGARVLDAFAPARARASAERRAALHALAAPTLAAALSALLDTRPGGIDADAFARNANRSTAAVAAQAAALGAVPLSLTHGTRWLRAGPCGALREAVPSLLATAHAGAPAARGLDDADLQDALAKALPWADRALRQAVLHELARDGAIVRDGFAWRLPGHVPRLDDDDAALLARVRAVLLEHGRRPPPLVELALRLDTPPDAAGERLRRFAALGHLVQVARNRFFLPETLQALVRVAGETLAASPDGRLDVMPFRDRSGLGRNLSVQVLEYFDRRHVTRFTKDARRVMLAG